MSAHELPEEVAIRERMVAAARQLVVRGLTSTTSGNMSARAGQGFLITPTGSCYESVQAEDLVYVDADWKARQDSLQPSSEWRLHRDVYARRPEAGAVVHVHSPFATTLACLRRAVPAFHYEVAFAGGKDIRCSEYATFGTQAFSDAALAALEDRKACLLANHGAVVFDRTLEEALRLAERVEYLARLYGQALQVGEPAVLPDDEMARVVERFATYGSS
jgi:L-fuculose-phosphate aldolase